MLGPAEIFTLVFVTLGPFKLFGPFAAQTRALDDAMLRSIAWRAFALGLVAIVAGGFIGSALVTNWMISIPAMLLAAGVIFFLVALQLVLQEYEPLSTHEAPALPSAPMAAALRLTFPTVVTPYGIAVVIALLTSTRDGIRMEIIVAIVAGVMVLNLLAMLFVRRIMAGWTLFVLQILGGVLGVLQVALAIQIVISALGRLGVLRVAT